MGRTLYDKIWDEHVIHTEEDGTSILYIDRHLVHEVTSPQAFEGLREAGRKVWRISSIVATADHNTPTTGWELGYDGITDLVSKEQITTLDANIKEFGAAAFFPFMSRRQGIVHVIGPENGATLPGMTVVCGDSHTSTHGAFGALAHGIGTSEVEHVMATQTLLARKAKNMLIRVEGAVAKGVTAKDIVLAIIGKIGTAGGTGYTIEFAGMAIRALSMEGRMTVCNMSIEMGARGGLIAPDATTFAYLKGRPFAPQAERWTQTLAYWQTLYSDEDAEFDAELTFDGAAIVPMITYGTNPGMGIALTGHIPAQVAADEAASFDKALQYMGFRPGESLLGKEINYVFIGSCTNSRIEDLRAVAAYVQGKHKAAHVEVIIVPGSKSVEKQAIAEGLDRILAAAGFELREPGCSACLAMNDDKIPAGAYCVSTSNRNFEGRQGPGARTLLVSPLVAAITAVEGRIVDITQYSN